MERDTSHCPWVETFVRVGVIIEGEKQHPISEEADSTREYMYETILIPTDGSETANAAAVHGLDIASRYDATVHALAVIDTAELLELGYFGGDRSDFEDTIEPLEEKARDAVDEIKDRAGREGVKTIGVVRQGAPFETIVTYATEADADLIVMGTHGRSGLERFLAGSVAERVVRTASAPVLTVRK